jgi:four helix bundle protein
MELAHECHRIWRLLPANERLSLGDQMWRAAISVPANIAEGHGRLSRAEYSRHLAIARGSLMELSTLLQLAQRTQILADDQFARSTGLVDEVSRMLVVLIRRLGTRRL